MQLYSIFLQHPNICVDSRLAAKNSIFFALKGDNFNANAFALSALEKGCVYAVVDEAEYAIDERFVLVDNVLESLQRLATFHRKQLGTPVIGITGTNGKTTTKELIAAVLKEKYTILFTQGNYNNHIGVPLTLLQLKPEHEIAIIEMGANHEGEIHQLCEIARPNYGIITNVGKAHLEGFGSFEGVKRTKKELYNYILRSGKVIFINKDNNELMEMLTSTSFSIKEENICGFGSNANYSIWGEMIGSSPFLEMYCTTTPEGSFKVKTKLIGAYNAENVMGAVAIGKYFNVLNQEIKQGLENYLPQNNRSQYTITENNKIVVDTYNANPTSMNAAIQNFAQMEGEDKILILGDMLELGDQSEVEHQNIVDILQQKSFANVVLIGPEFKKTNHPFKSYNNVDELISSLTSCPIINKSILIKGSRGIKLEKILPIL